MANLNVVTAGEVVDNDLTDDEIKFLYDVRNGIALDDVDGNVFNDLYLDGFVDVVDFTNIRASTAIKGVVLSEEGFKIMNVLEERERLKPKENIELTEKAISTEKDGVEPENAADESAGTLPDEKPTKPSNKKDK